MRGVGGWDAIKAFVQFGIRSPISPVAKTEPDVVAGRALFQSANCQSCHGGPQWTNSTINFKPPPAAVQVVAGQLVDQLRNVGTFDPTVLNEIRQNAQPPLGAAGFVPPSLLSLHAFPETFLHNGSANSLDQVLANVTHRSAGTGGVDTLASAADRAKLVRFLLSIDAATVPIAPSTANVIEYFNAGLDHYFITHLDAEIAKLDAGDVIKGWTRTGKFFLVNLAPRTRNFAGVPLLHSAGPRRLAFLRPRTRRMQCDRRRRTRASCSRIRRSCISSCRPPACAPRARSRSTECSAIGRMRITAT